jgi:hypothetical protein
MNPEEQEKAWAAVLAAGIEAQLAVPGCVAVGGTAAAIYAHHRFSADTDHLVHDLRSRFQMIREKLELTPGWREARVQPPVLILGSIRGVEVGFRQSRRRDAIETSVVTTAAGKLVVPTLDEMIGMKAYMAYSRNAARDFLDFAALAEVAGKEATLTALCKSDARYGHLQSTSVALLIAGVLCEPRPFDLDDVDLKDYKGLLPEWQNWSRVRDICVDAGRRLASWLVIGS